MSPTILQCQQWASSGPASSLVMGPTQVPPPSSDAVHPKLKQKLTLAPLSLSCTTLPNCYTATWPTLTAMAAMRSLAMLLLLALAAGSPVLADEDQCETCKSLVNQTREVRGPGRRWHVFRFRGGHDVRSTSKSQMVVLSTAHPWEAPLPESILTRGAPPPTSIRLISAEPRPLTDCTQMLKEHASDAGDFLSKQCEKSPALLKDTCDKVGDRSRSPGRLYTYVW